MISSERTGNLLVEGSVRNDLEAVEQRRLDVKGSEVITVSGGVYMRKLAPARVSYRDEFLISDRLYMMTGSFHISLFEGTLHVVKIKV